MKKEDGLSLMVEEYQEHLINKEKTRELKLRRTWQGKNLTNIKDRVRYNRNKDKLDFQEEIGEYLGDIND